MSIKYGYNQLKDVVRTITVEDLFLALDRDDLERKIANLCAGDTLTIDYYGVSKSFTCDEAIDIMCMLRVKGKW